MVGKDVDKTVKATTNQTIEEDVVANAEVQEEDLQLSNHNRSLLAQVANGVMPKMAQLSE
jgi:hypothetical protein